MRQAHAEPGRLTQARLRMKPPLKVYLARHFSNNLAGQFLTRLLGKQMQPWFWGTRLRPRVQEPQLARAQVKRHVYAIWANGYACGCFPEEMYNAITVCDGERYLHWTITHIGGVFI